MLTPIYLCMGLVIGVLDGETLRVRCEAPNLGEIRVRLDEIDAPHKRQPFAKDARKQLKTLAVGKMAAITKITLDHQGRVVARVVPVGESELSFEMVRRGYAKCAPKQLVRTDECLAAQSAAKEARLGLWVNAEPQPP